MALCGRGLFRDPNAVRGTPVGYMLAPMSPGRRILPLVVSVVAVAALLPGCGDTKTIVEKTSSTKTVITKEGGKTTTVVPAGGGGSSVGGGGASGSGSGGLSYTGASPGFAQNVRDEYVRRGGGDITVTAYSAANGRNYDIVCVRGARVVCQGGTTKNAYITFDP